MGKIIEEGAPAPAFDGIDQQGNHINSNDLKGQKYILFFYPKANTPGCTKEACNLNENLDALAKEGYKIIGVSADSIEKQKKFSDKYGFNYPLIADTDKKIINAFGVWGPKKFMGKEYDGIHRTTFLIDETGHISHIIKKVKTKAHTAQILEEIKKEKI